MRTSLSVKIIGAFSLLTGILFVGVVYLSLSNQKTDLTESFIEKAKSTAYSLGASINNKESLQNKDQLILNIQKSMWLDADIISISFNVPQGEGMAAFISSDLSAVNQSSNVENLESFTKDIPVNKIVSIGASEILKMIIPIDISGKTEGTIQVNFTLENINKKINSEFNNLIWSFLSISFLFLVLTYLFIRFIVLSPIRKISKGIEAIQKNNFDYKINLKTNDELSTLAKVFNKMSQDLKESHMFLETKVKDRTEQLNKKIGELMDSEKAVINLLGDLKGEKEDVERKVEERTRELSEAQARLLSSINSLSFGFVIADKEHNILFKNNAAIELFNLKENDISIDNISKLFAEHFNLKDEIKICLKGQAVCEIKEIIFGAKILRSLVAPIIITKDQETIGYVLIFEDITEAKVMERSRDEFFAVASHELRTPLTAIRGNADMLLEMFTDKIVDSDMREMLKDIDASSIRLINIVNDFLEVSRLEQRRIDIKKESFNASDVIEKVVRDMKTVIEQKGLSITYTAPASPLPLVFADKNRTEEVLINLIGNAMKFTKSGTITITTSVNGGFFALRVVDTGSGISEQNQTLLFRKFQQAGEQMLARDVTQSTGLGLYISKLIVSNMGGTIELEKSELGKGSTFIFTLPIAK